jgi:hypothetical protein
MAASPCLITIHGIGFQQPPTEGRPGYADALHENLRTKLGDHLGDDPERPGEHGPVYVSSEVNGSLEQGLARLDPGRPLAPAGKIAHVALYSPSEPLKPRLGSVGDTLIRAILAHNRYVSTLGGIRLALEDGWAALHEKGRGVTDNGDVQSTLLPRNDLEPAHHHRRLTDLLPGHHPSAPAEPGPLGTFRALEDDMATYVARNDLRERVRGFVQDVLLALVALTGTGEVSNLVMNAHSQGTMISWDVLCRMPFESWRGPREPGQSVLSAYVTAGSPIRKYVDLFTWGEQVGQMRPALDAGLRWSNFWDRHDPVADPLNPATAWRPGDPIDERTPRDLGLLESTDPVSGEKRHVEISDTLVDNVANSSGGGLQAHDYWNNVEEFVEPLAAILTDAEPASARA